MNISRRALCRRWAGLAASLGLLAGAGCGGGGVLSSEPKKYEGGGPLPEMKGDEIPDPPKGKTKKR